jgi:general transcription factor 3C polypeptide 6
MLESTLENTDNTNETEILILLEFTDSNEAKYSQENNNNFKVLEVESNNPVLQIGNRLYLGEYINNIGTYLFFEERQDQTNSPKPDSLNSQRIGYKGKTFKKLLLNRIYLEKKD